MRKINDKLILGLLVGLIANIPKTILCETLRYKGITKRKCSNLAAGLFITNRFVFTKKGNVFGILCDFIVASFDGIAFIYLLAHSGKLTRNNAIIKGFFSGIFSFGIFRGFLARLGTAKVYPKDILTNLIMGINSSVWGITAGLLTLLLGHKDLFKPKHHLQSNSAAYADPSLDSFDLKRI